MDQTLRVEVKPDQGCRLGAIPAGKRFHLCQVSLLGETPTLRNGDRVSVFVDVGDVAFLVGTLSAEKPAVAFSRCRVLEEGFKLLHDGTDASVCFDVHCVQDPDAGTTAGTDDVASDEEEEVVFLDMVPLDVLYKGSGLPGDGEMHEMEAPFAFVDNVACYMRMATVAREEDAAGGQEVVVLYRNNFFSPAMGGQGVECNRTTFHRLRFVLPEACDLLTALPWISSSLQKLLYPKNCNKDLDRTCSKNLDAVWSCLLAGHSLPPQTSSCLRITADVGILEDGDPSLENMEHMQCALEAMLEEEWLGFHADVEVRLPGVVRYEEAAAEPDGSPAAKRRREAVTEVTECAICLEEYERGGGVAQMRCSHVFHESCLRRWLKESVVCPLCRYEMASSVDR